jgi:hypothetical protein
MAVVLVLVSFFNRLLGSVVCHREGSALVVTVFLVRIIECLEERFLLVRSILIYLRLGQTANRLVGHWIFPSYPLLNINEIHLATFSRLIKRRDQHHSALRSWIIHKNGKDRYNYCLI